MPRPYASAWPMHDYRVDMYDDRPHPDEGPGSNSRSQSHLTSRKDYERTPPRGTVDRYDEPGWSGPVGDDGRRHERSRSRSRERGRRSDVHRARGFHSGRKRSRSRSPYYGGPPNRTIILDGTMDLTQEDILNELQHRLHVDGIEEVRLIKDKRTGQSRQFAFAQFVDIGEATSFLDHYYPSMSLHRSNNPSLSGDVEEVRVRIAYSREREDKEHHGKSDDDWKCEICYISNFFHRSMCFRCNAPRTRSTAHGIMVAQTNGSSHSGFMTTGDSDVSPDGSASQFILIRGLEPGTHEELLAKGVSKLFKIKPNIEGIDDRAPKKGKVSSTVHESSLGAKEGSLRRVLLVRDRRSNESWRYGFAEFDTVDNAQAALAKYKSLERFTISSRPVLASHIHAGVFVPVLTAITNDLTRFTFSPLSNPAMRLMYWDENAYVSELPVALDDRTSAAKNRESEHAELAAPTVNEGIVEAGKESGPKQKKRKIEKDSKVVAPHLQFWTTQHAELHGKASKEAEIGQFEVIEGNGRYSGASPTTSFADLERKCCLLCSRQFQDAAEVNKHERLSQLHHDNLKDDELVLKATAKVKKAQDRILNDSAYRDRAKERRKAYNQPKQPGAKHHRPAKEDVAVTNVEKPTQSKGAALLGKMGWTAGEGLGAQGLGITDTIKTQLYTQGVGLGAEGGKVGDATEEAERQTNGSYADFVAKSKEKAKARFESL